MHILHLIKTSEGATWALNLMKDIIIAHPEITFSVVLPSGGKHFDEYKSICESVYEFNFSLGLTLFKNGRLLRKIIEKDKPDVIHSWFTQTTLYARLFLRKYRIPRLFQVVGPLHLENPLFKWADILSADNNDYWIATSQYIINKYKSFGIKDDCLFLNYAYVDVIRLLKDKENVIKREFRSEFNIPEHYKIIGTASYIYPPKFYERIGVKGHEYLLRSFAEILTKRKDFVLVIAGSSFGKDTAYEKKLKRIASRIDSRRIIFTGKYSHIYEVISNFDVFVYLSKSENLGGVFESLLFEIPTVSSNRGALPELVIDGVTGLTVDIENTDEIASRILQLLEMDNKKMTQTGKVKVLDTFKKDVIINKGYSIYQQVLNTPKQF